MSFFANLWPVLVLVAVILFVGWAVVWIISRKKQGLREVAQVTAVLAIIIGVTGFLMSLHLSRWQLVGTLMGIFSAGAIGSFLYKEYKHTTVHY